MQTLIITLRHGGLCMPRRLAHIEQHTGQMRGRTKSESEPSPDLVPKFSFGTLLAPGCSRSAAGDRRPGTGATCSYPEPHRHILLHRINDIMLQSSKFFRHDRLSKRFTLCAAGESVPGPS